MHAEEVGPRVGWPATFTCRAGIADMTGCNLALLLARGDKAIGNRMRALSEERWRLVPCARVQYRQRHRQSANRR